MSLCECHTLWQPGETWHFADCGSQPRKPEKTRHRYVVELDVPDKRRGHWTTIVVGAFRSVESAVRRLSRVLERHTVNVTMWGPKPRFAFAGRVVDRKARHRGKETVIYLDAPERIVPSVGDVGVW